MIAIVPVVFCLIGLVVYLLTTHPKVSEVARLTFGAGLLVALFVFAQHTVRLIAS